MTPRRMTRAKTDQCDPLEVLYKVWQERGANAIATLRKHDPASYVRLVASVISERTRR